MEHLNEIIRTIKHVLYMVLVVCWFGFWYAIFGLVTGLWNIDLWTDTIWYAYSVFAIGGGFFYLLYRIYTY